MGVTREDLVRSGQWLEKSDAEWELQRASVERTVNGYLGNDAWAPKIKQKVGVLLTASVNGRPYLKGSVESFRKLGYWIVLAYDNFIDPTWPTIDYNGWMPPKDVMEQIDTFLLATPYQTWGGVSYPHMFQLRIASGIFHSFDYVLVANGDCIIEKPEGLQTLIAMMGDTDFFSAGPTLDREVGTAAYLARPKAFTAIAKHLIDHVVPFEEYEKSTQEFGNTEGRFAMAIKELGITQTIAPVFPSCPSHQPTCEQLHQPSGTWYDLLGLRHIHGELNYAHRYRYVPPPSRYLDPRYVSENDLRACQAYETTGDKSVLTDWWAK